MNTSTYTIINNSCIRHTLFLLYVMITTPVLGQVREVHNVPSPEVASLGTFGAIPVGHYTGTANITVPLYTIQVGKLNVPIQAQYHPANVKPHTPPSCLGIGWVLSAGGYITRVIKGKQDEKEIAETKPGYFFNYAKIKDLDKTPGNGKAQKLTELTHLFGNDWYELAADEFSFNVNGHTGTFFMDKDGDWRVVSDENIKVEFDEQTGFKKINDLKKRFFLAYYAVSDNMRFFDRFTLITPDGTRYEFGGDGATEYCVPYYNQVYGDIVSTCWRLTKITTVDNRIIDFKYVADSYMCDIHYAPQTIAYYDDNACFRKEYNTGRSGYSGFLIMPSRLEKIISSNEIVLFNYRRDRNYGEMFLQNTGCLYWSTSSVPYGDPRYFFNFERELSAHSFCLFTDVVPSRSDSETQREIAKKITQDYLTSIAVYGAKSFNLDWMNKTPRIEISFDLEGIRRRRLLSKISISARRPLIWVESIGDDDDTVTDSTSNDKLKWEDLDPFVATDHPSTDIEPKLYNPNWPMQPRVEFEYKFDYYQNLESDEMWSLRIPLIYTDSWGYYCKYAPGPIVAGEWDFSKRYVENDFKRRTPDLESTKLFMLKGITYPTGGRTEIEYEAHDFSKYFDRKKNCLIENSGLVGGLRVKLVKNYDVSDRLLYTKGYIYKDRIGGKSSGISKGIPCFHERIYGSGRKHQYVDFYSFDSMEPYPLNFNTPDVGYSTVFEDLKDAEGNLLRRTKFQYTNYDTDIYGETHEDQPADYVANVFDDYAFAPFTSFAFERGKLMVQEVMDNKGNTLRKDTYKYVRTHGEPCSTVAQGAYRYGRYQMFGISYLYKTYTNKYLVAVHKTETKMENGNAVSEKKYAYTFNGLIDRIETASLADNHFITYIYGFAKREYLWMVNRNILLPIGVLEGGTNTMCTSKHYVYKQLPNGCPYLAQQISTYANWASGQEKVSRVDYTVERADKYGNPIVVDEKGTKTIMVWSHLGQRLAASIQNATYDEVQTALGNLPESFSDRKLSTSDYEKLRALREKLPKALVYTYFYDDNNLLLTDKTEPNGMQYHYSYDGLGKLRATYRIINGKYEVLNVYRYNYKTREK